jgi:hydrogenase expression/formation protein HypC
MCLGVPGKITDIKDDAIGLRMGTVEFGGVAREVCLAYTPEAVVGDWVVVHAGFAISCLNEQEAQDSLDALAELATMLDSEDSPTSLD